jgi:hypothetical protein
MNDGDNLRGFDREWPEFLDEIRVTLPGVQLLFGFLLAAPFSSNFTSMTSGPRLIYFICFLCTTAACAFLVAPSVYHRLHWRRDVHDKEEMIRTCNRLAIAGVSLLAIAMTTAVYVVGRVVSTGLAALVVTVIAALVFFTLWFALPMVRRERERGRPQQ